MNIKKSFSLIILGLLLFTGCDQLQEIVSNTGTINITIDSDLNNRTITPELDMAPSYYTINGAGPLEETFTQNVYDGDSATFGMLLPGEWTVTVDAYNINDTKIGTGSELVTVTENTASNLTITVSPISGEGTLTLDLTWADEVADPSIVATLTSAAGDITNLSFTVTDNSATFTDLFINGYYLLDVKLYDSGEDTGLGYSEAVRIIYDQTTYLDVTIEDVYQQSLEIIINTNLENPMDITFEGEQNYITTGNSMTISATVDTTPDSYAWYLNGTLLADETSSNITIGTDLAPGFYYLTLVVKKGNILSSASSTFTVNTPGAGANYGIYIREQNKNPWSQTDNEAALDTVFSDGDWETVYFETVDIDSILVPGNLIIIDGSDSGAIELATFLSANITKLEDWVANGGALFLNCAPNEGGDVDFGFNGTTMLDSGNQSSAAAVDETHPIFIGPVTPVATSYTGSSFSHGYLQGTDLTNILANGEYVVLAEKSWGNGIVMFGSMTMPNYHTPKDEALNLRTNIFHYLKDGWKQ